jgi:hypothetical protein
MHEILEGFVRPDYDDATIRRRLGSVHFIVHLTLSEDLEVIERLADGDEFEANVEREGERKVIELLRDTAKRGSWPDLFESRTCSTLLPQSAALTMFLHIEIFFKSIPEDTEPISTASADGA